MRSVAGRLRAGVADTEPRLDEHADAELVDALSRAAGLPVVLDAVERDYRREACARTGWPFTRWVRPLRPDPLRRLRLSAARGRRASVTPTPSPSRTSVRCWGVHRCRRRRPRAVRGRAGHPGARRPGGRAAAAAVVAVGGRRGDPAGDDLGDALDRAVMRTPLRTRNPLWWGAFNLLQWLLALAAVLGLAWLAVLAGMAWLRLPEPGTPRVGILPVPTLMLLGGLVLGLVLSALARPLARIGARRRRKVIARRLRDSVGVVARELDRGPGAGRPGPPPHDPRAARHRRRPPRPDRLPRPPAALWFCGPAPGPPRGGATASLSTAGGRSSHGPQRRAGRSPRPRACRLWEHPPSWRAQGRDR